MKTRTHPIASFLKKKGVSKSKSNYLVITSEFLEKMPLTSRLTNKSHSQIAETQNQFQSNH